MVQEKKQYYILVVDDDPKLGKLFKEVLEDDECIVHSVTSGEEAIRLSKGISFDLVFLDMILPGMNGVEVLGKLKEINKNIRVVVMTGYAVLGMLEEASKIGAIKALIKPFHMEQLQETVEESKKEADKISVTKKYSALLIDDQNLIQSEFYGLLKELNFDIEEFLTITDAQENADNKEFDLIILNASPRVKEDFKKIVSGQNQILLAKRLYMIDEQEVHIENLKKHLRESF